MSMTWPAVFFASLISRDKSQTFVCVSINGNAQEQFWDYLALPTVTWAYINRGPDSAVVIKVWSLGTCSKHSPTSFIFDPSGQSREYLSYKELERLHMCLVIDYTKNKYAERKVLVQALNSDFTSPFSNGTRHILRNKGSFLNK